jgi:hypothetical protein
MATKQKPPQLVWDRGLPIWRATRAAIKAGFPTKRVNLKCFAHDEAALDARCHRLTAEQNEWLDGRHVHDPLFDGTIGSDIKFWQPSRLVLITESKRPHATPMTSTRA